MSALPPKADIRRPDWNVRFVPKRLCLFRLSELFRVLDGRCRVATSLRLAFTYRTRLFSCFVCGWRRPGRWKAVEFRRSIEPNPCELPVGLANFIRLRLARPFKTFVGHRTILGGRFHETASTPSPQGRAANFGRRRRRKASDQRKPSTFTN